MILVLFGCNTAKYYANLRIGEFSEAKLHSEQLSDTVCNGNNDLSIVFCTDRVCTNRDQNSTALLEDYPEQEFQNSDPSFESEKSDYCEPVIKQSNFSENESLIPSVDRCKKKTDKNTFESSREDGVFFNMLFAFILLFALIGLLAFLIALIFVSASSALVVALWTMVIIAVVLVIYIIIGFILLSKVS